MSAEKNRFHVCVRFVKAGSMRIGQLSIDVDGKKASMSANLTLWKCCDCESTFWLKTGIDPNMDIAAVERPVKKLKS